MGVAVVEAANHVKHKSAIGDHFPKSPEVVIFLNRLQYSVMER